MAKRFTKKRVIEFLKRKIQHSMNVYSFNPDKRYFQVENKGEALNRAYGAYSAALTLLTCVEEGIIEKDIVINKTFTRPVFEKCAQIMTKHYLNKNSFDPSNGYSQVINLGEELNREYGKYYFYKCLIDNLDYFLIYIL